MRPLKLSIALPIASVPIYAGHAYLSSREISIGFNIPAVFITVLASN
jgi:hypothetical protein